MARGVDSDYMHSIPLVDGFDMGINFDEFGENMKKFMELPIKYLDSAHDKAVGLVEDIHAFVCAPFPKDEVPNRGHETLTDPSSNNVISPTSVETEQVDPNEEFSSSSTSLITAEDSSFGSIDNDAHETESLSSKCRDSYVSEDTTPIGRTVSVKEGVILCNAEYLSDSCTPIKNISLGRTVSIEDEVILWNPGNYVKPPQSPEPTTMVQDYVSHEVKTDKVKGQIGLHSSVHSESSCNGSVLLGKISANGEEQLKLYIANDPLESTKLGDILNFSGGAISHHLRADVFNGANDPNMLVDDITCFVNIDLQDDQEQMKNNKAEASSVPQPKNTSFKKILMKSLSNKLRWSKKDNVHQAIPIRPHQAVNTRYEAAFLSDDLEDDWELL